MIFLEVKKVLQINKSLLDKAYGRYMYNDLGTDDYSREYIEKRINQILSNGFGLELYENGEPIGFICAYELDELFYHEKGCYTPEIGIYCDLDLEKVNSLLKALYEEMRKRGFTHHSITLVQPIPEDFWVEFGYGCRVVDVARWVAVEETKINLKKIKEEDLDEFYPLYQEHELYMGASPIFLDTNPSKEACLKDLKNKSGKLFFIMDGDIKVGYTLVDEKEASGSEFFKDKTTLAIGSTHILEKYQHQGYGKEAIIAIMNYAHERGFNRISTDYESFNYKANRFWPRFFATVAKSYVRYIGK